VNRTRRKRIATGLLIGAVALLATFGLPADLFFLIALATSWWAAAEYVRITRRWAPSAPLGSLLVMLPLAAGALFFLLRQDIGSEHLGPGLAAGATALVLSSALVTLFGRTEMAEATSAIGILAFGVPYFALPPVSFYYLKRLDPWLVFLLLALVVFGDSAAYFVGSSIGRRKMARVVSPNKTWEGAVAGFLVSLATVAAWSLVKLGELHPWLLVVGAVTAAAAQLGDLVESLIKRGAGVKDSSQLLPGHGGMFDRADAMLFAAPVFVLGLWLIGW